jgi:phi13 family phage major tail protein
MSKIREKYTVDQVHLSPLTTDTKEELTYGESFVLEGMQDFAHTVTENSTPIYYDARHADNVYDAQKEEIELTLFGITPENLAKILNYAYDKTTGQFTKVPGATRPQFALQARNGYIKDTAKRYFTFYKVEFAELSDEQIKNMSESYSANPIKLKGVVMETKHQVEYITINGDNVKAGLRFDAIDDDVVESVDWETVYFEKVNTPAEIKAIATTE